MSVAAIIISTIVFALIFGAIMRWMAKGDFSVPNVVVATLVYLVVVALFSIFG